MFKRIGFWGLAFAFLLVAWPMASSAADRAMPTAGAWDDQGVRLKPQLSQENEKNKISFLSQIDREMRDALRNYSMNDFRKGKKSSSEKEEKEIDAVQNRINILRAKRNNILGGQTAPLYSGTPTSTTTLIVDAAPVQGNIDPAGEYDFYQFTVTTAGYYKIETWLETLTDSYMYLYGPNDSDNLLEEDDDGGTGLASKITRYLEPGTYYVTIRGYNSSYTGTYTISVVTTAAGTVSGRVTDISSAGIENVSVEIYDLDWNYLTNVWTDSDGYYTASGVPAGNVKVYFYARYAGNYFSEWYNDKADFDTADSVSVPNGGTVSGINAQLAPGGAIGGRVTDASSAAIEGVEVEVYNTEGDYLGNAYTDSDGNYSRGGLVTGNYKVQFYGIYAGNYVNEWYNNKTNFDAADPVPVTVEQTTTINAQLATGGFLSGQVTAADTAAGSSVFSTGLAEVEVYVYDLNGYGVSYGWTDENGNYTAQGIPAGNCKVEFYPYSGENYVSEWYNDKRHFDTADLVGITAGSTTTINAQLTQGGIIAGRVVDASGVGIQNVRVRVYDLDYYYIGARYTDSNGYYAMQMIPPGFAKVYFYTGSAAGDYLSEWYDNKDSFENADQVPFASGQTTFINAVLVPDTTLPIIGISKSTFNFAAVQKGKTTPQDSVLISNLGTGALNWTAVSSQPWLVPSPNKGPGGKTMKIKIVKANKMAVGTYTGTITITDPNASNSPVTINVTLVVKAAGTDAVPFGEFNTPADGATVNTATTNVSGWALDDVGMKWAKVYLKLSATKKKLIGTAKFIAGARPDIEVGYPTYPQNNRAGWTFTLAMKKLPNKGVGTFVLMAYVQDLGGHQVLVGTHTITGVAPSGGAAATFEDLAVPEDGATVSGSTNVSVDNLTAWVDGLPVGSLNLDTSKYVDGWHTLAWNVVDSSGAVDEIGTRYFKVQNEAPISDSTEKAAANEASMGEEAVSPVIGDTPSSVRSLSEIASVPEDGRTPVFLKRSFGNEQIAEAAYPEADGAIRIRIPQASRLAVYLNQEQTFENEAEQMARAARILSNKKSGDRSLALSPNPARFQAHSLVGSELRPLPIGASFDSRDGIFFWQLGPGFLGEHQIVLVDSASGTRKTITITLD